MQQTKAHHLCIPLDGALYSVLHLTRFPVWPCTVTLAPAGWQPFWKRCTKSCLSPDTKVSFVLCRPCLFRCASWIAQHYTPKMILKSAIFSTPKSGKILHNKIQNANLQHTWIFWEVLFVAQQAFLNDKAYIMVFGTFINTLLPLWMFINLNLMRAARSTGANSIWLMASPRCYMTGKGYWYKGHNVEVNSIVDLNVIDERIWDLKYTLSAYWIHIKGIFSDSNNIFLWHESEDTNKKSLLPRFQLIPILHKLCLIMCIGIAP